MGLSHISQERRQASGSVFLIPLAFLFWLQAGNSNATMATPSITFSYNCIWRQGAESNIGQKFSLHASFTREEKSFPKAPCRHPPTSHWLERGQDTRGWEWLCVTNQQWVSQAKPFLGSLFLLGFHEIFCLSCHCFFPCFSSSPHPFSMNVPQASLYNLLPGQSYIFS